MSSLFIEHNRFTVDPRFRCQSKESRVRIKRHVAVQIDHLTKRLNFKTNGQTIEWLLHQAEPAITIATGRGLIKFPGVNPPQIPSNMSPAYPVGKSKKSTNSSAPTGQLSDMVVSGSHQINPLNRSSMSRGAIERSYAKRPIHDRGNFSESSVTLYGTSIVPIGSSNMSLTPNGKRHASGKSMAFSSMPSCPSGIKIAEYSSYEKVSVSENRVSLYNPSRVVVGASDVSYSYPASDSVSIPMLPYYEKPNDAGTNENIYSPSSKAQVSLDMSFSIPAKQENLPGDSASLYIPSSSPLCSSYMSDPLSLYFDEENFSGDNANSCTDQQGNVSGGIANSCAEQGDVSGKTANPNNTSSDIPYPVPTYNEEGNILGNNVDRGIPSDMTCQMPLDVEHGIFLRDNYNFYNPYDVPFGSPEYSLTLPSFYGQENDSGNHVNLYNPSIPLNSSDTAFAKPLDFEKANALGIQTFDGNSVPSGVAQDISTSVPQYPEFGKQLSTDWPEM